MTDRIVRTATDLASDTVAPEPLDSFDALDRWANTLIDLTGDGGGPGPGDGLEHVDHWAALLGNGLRAMRDRGDLRPDADPDELALGLLSALHGGRLLTQVRRDGRPLRAALNMMLARVRSYATDDRVRCR